jgi:hypothetical protein
MKKIIFLICLLALALILFASCRDKNGDAPANANNNGGSPGEINMENLYFFRSLGGAVKINPVSQTVSHVCIDPLCEHGLPCPVYGADHYVTGNYIFYKARGEERYISGTANQWESSTKILVYNMITGVVRELAEHWDYVRFIDATGSYLFYANPRANEEDDALVDFIVYRADARTGNVIEINKSLTDKANHFYPDIYAITGDTIYWYEWWTTNFYTTDLDGNIKAATTEFKGLTDTIFEGPYHNGYAHYTLPQNYAPQPPIVLEYDGTEKTFEEAFAEYHQRRNEEVRQRQLQRANMSEYERERAIWERKLIRVAFDIDNPNIEELPVPPDHDERLPPPRAEYLIHNAEFVADSVLNYIFHGDKIYFMAMDDEPELIEYGGAHTWNWSGGKIWVMNLDGTDKRLIADTGYNLNTRWDSLFDAKTIDGVDYIAVLFVLPERRRTIGGYDIFFLPSPDTIIINASTGEWVVLPPPE